MSQMSFAVAAHPQDSISCQNNRQNRSTPTLVLITEKKKRPFYHHTTAYSRRLILAHQYSSASLSSGSHDSMPFISRKFSLSDDPSSERQRFKTVVRKSLRLDYLIHQPGRTASLPQNAPSTIGFQPTSDARTMLDSGMKSALSEPPFTSENAVVEKELQQGLTANLRRGKIIGNIFDIEDLDNKKSASDISIRCSSSASGLTSISKSQHDRSPFLCLRKDNSSGNLVPNFGTTEIYDWCLPSIDMSYQPPYIIEPDEPETIQIALSPPPYYYPKLCLRDRRV